MRLTARECFRSVDGRSRGVSVVERKVGNLDEIAIARTEGRVLVMGETTTCGGTEL
jgi:hypothetical protein